MLGPPIKHTILFVVVAAVSLWGSCGCASGNGPIRSNLAGGWIIERTETVEIDLNGDRHVRSAESDDDNPRVLVSEDGTFDWSSTILGMVAMATGRPMVLKYTGDRIDFTEEQTGGSSGYIKVIESRYTPNLTYVKVRCHIEPSRYDEDYSSPAYNVDYSFRARLRLDGKADVRMIRDARMIESNSQYKRTDKQLLKRSDKPLPIRTIEDLDAIQPEGELLHFVASKTFIRCLDYSPDG